VGLSKDLGFPQPLVAFEWHLRARCAHLDFFLFLFLFVQDRLSTVMDHGMEWQQEAAARPSVLNVIRAPGKAESAAPAYVLVEYAPESGEADLCLQCAGVRAAERLPLVFGHV